MSLSHELDKKSGAKWRRIFMVFISVAPIGADYLAVSASFGAKWRHLVAFIGDRVGARLKK